MPSPKSFYLSSREFIKAHERQLPTFALILGFIWDYLTLGRPDRIFDNAVMLFYLTLSGIGILVLSFRQGKGETPSLFLLSLIQFAFGSISSGLFVIYGVSGTFSGSWLFFLILGSVLIG